MSGLLSYPQSPGWKREDTAREAARKVSMTCAKWRALILATLGTNGTSTADEFADLFAGGDYFLIRPRFSELRNLGQIKPSGERRKNAKGNSQIAWRRVGA